MDTTMVELHPHLLRLMHLVSPSLPTGAFAYSQGLEWAVDNDWVKDVHDLKRWLADLIDGNMTYVDIPLLKRMYSAGTRLLEDDLMDDDLVDEELARWCDCLLAMRETQELRMEENNRGRAMLTVLESLQVPFSEAQRREIARCQLAGFALASANWGIPVTAAASGYLWSWLENMVVAGIKIVPLGQSQGHRLLADLDGTVMAAVARGLQLGERDIGASSPALAIASSHHETQYTRLYRS